MTGCVTNDKKQNLTNLEKILLNWNFKLGRTGLSTVQCIGRQVWLGKMGDNMGSNNVNITKFSDWHYGN